MTLWIIDNRENSFLLINWGQSHFELYFFLPSSFFLIFCPSLFSALFPSSFHRFLCLIFQPISLLLHSVIFNCFQSAFWVQKNPDWALIIKKLQRHVIPTKISSMHKKASPSPSNDSLSPSILNMDFSVILNFHIPTISPGVTLLFMIEPNIITEPTGVRQKLCPCPWKITASAATVTTDSTSFSSPLKQLKDLPRRLGIYVLMA